MDSTIKFRMQADRRREMQDALREVYAALAEKGYNPINQMVGYILTEDPTYITNYKNARRIMSRLDRDELLQELVRSYLGE